MRAVARGVQAWRRNYEAREAIRCGVVRECGRHPAVAWHRGRASGSGGGGGAGGRNGARAASGLPDRAQGGAGGRGEVVAMHGR